MARTLSAEGRSASGVKTGSGAGLNVIAGRGAAAAKARGAAHSRGRGGGRAAARQAGASPKKASAKPAHPRKRKLPPGECECDICFSRPHKDASGAWQWGQVAMKQGPDGTPTSMPEGPACQNCALLRQKGWGQIEWEEFTQLYHNNQTFWNKVEGARKVMQGQSKDFVEEEIVGEQLQQLEVQRVYDICTEKELSSSAKKYRLPKAELQKLPQLLVPSEANPSQMEWAYAFRSEQFPHRMAFLKTSLGHAKRQKLMDPDAHIQPDQGKETLDCLTSQQREATGQSALAKKRYADVPTFSEFVRRFHKPPGDAEASTMDDFLRCSCYGAFMCVQAGLCFDCLNPVTCRCYCKMCVYQAVSS